MTVNKTGSLYERVGSVEYIMNSAMADEILKTRKGDDKKLRPQDYLIKYVNEDCGLLRNCTKVTVI